MTEAVKNALAHRGKVVDSLCTLKGEATTKNKAAGAGSDSTGALIFDTGGGYTEAVCVIDLNSVATGATVSVYRLSLQGSNDSAFASPIVNMPLLEVGHADVVPHTREEAAAARYLFPVSNDFGGDLYRYLRIYLIVGATPGITGIDYEANLTVN